MSTPVEANKSLGQLRVASILLLLVVLLQLEQLIHAESDDDESSQFSPGQVSDELSQRLDEQYASVESNLHIQVFDEKVYSSEGRFPEPLDCGRADKFVYSSPSGFDCKGDPSTAGGIKAKPTKKSANRARISERVASGYATKPGEFPSYVRLAINVDGRWATCGGTLINANQVLTANHCLRGNVTQVVAQVGVTSRKGAEPDSHVIKKVCLMNGYTIDEDGGSHRDVAVINLPRPVTYSKTVQPACLGTRIRHLEGEAACYLVGAGRFQDRGGSSDKPLALLVHQSCDHNFERAERSCFHSCPRMAQGSSCFGDSGGPVYCIDKCGGKTRQVVVGGVSFGSNYCTPGKDRRFYTADYATLGPDIEKLIDFCQKRMVTKIASG